MHIYHPCLETRVVVLQYLFVLFSARFTDSVMSPIPTSVFFFQVCEVTVLGCSIDAVQCVLLAFCVVWPAKCNDLHDACMHDLSVSSWCCQRVSRSCSWLSVV